MASHESTTSAKYATKKSICLNCGVEFYRTKAQKYCSYSCRAKFNIERMTANLPEPKPFEDRFWEKVDRSDHCWEWQGGLHSNGYGRISVPKTGQQSSVAFRYIEGLAHRVAWQLRTGEALEKTILILHTCDNRRCVRNDEEGWYEVNGIVVRRYGHLFLGTTQDNIADKVSKHRQGAARGMASGHAKFTDDDIREIRRLNRGGLGKRKIAAMYGVGQTTIHCIVRYITWTHVLDEE